jgi:hypothetical protein
LVVFLACAARERGCSSFAGFVFGSAAAGDSRIRILPPRALCRPWGFILRLVLLTPEIFLSSRAAHARDFPFVLVLLTPEIFLSFSCSALPVFRTCWSPIEARIFVSLNALPELLFLFLDLLSSICAPAWSLVVVSLACLLCCSVFEGTCRFVFPDFLFAPSAQTWPQFSLHFSFST